MSQVPSPVVSLLRQGLYVERPCLQKKKTRVFNWFETSSMGYAGWLARVGITSTPSSCPALLTWPPELKLGLGTHKASILLALKDFLFIKKNIPNPLMLIHLFYPSKLSRLT